MIIHSNQSAHVKLLNKMQDNSIVNSKNVYESNNSVVNDPIESVKKTEGKTVSRITPKIPEGNKNTSSAHNIEQRPSSINVITDIEGPYISKKVSSVIVNGILGDTISLPSYTKQAGYHLNSIILWHGEYGNKRISVESNPISSVKLEYGKETLVYTLSPNMPSEILRTVNVINPKTEKVIKTLVENKEVTSGLCGQTINIPKYKIPKGYTLYSDNMGNTVNLDQNIYHQIINIVQSKVKPIENKNTSSAHNIKQRPSSINVITDIEGPYISKKLSNVSVNGILGETVSLPSYTKQAGYHITNISLWNGNKYIKSENEPINSIKLKYEKETLAYTLSPNMPGNILRTVNVINPKTGKVIKTLVENKEVVSGLCGQTINIPKYKIPKGYILYSNSMGNTVNLDQNIYHQIINIVQNKAKPSNFENIKRMDTITSDKIDKISHQHIKGTNKTNTVSKQHIVDSNKTNKPYIIVNNKTNNISNHNSIDHQKEIIKKNALGLDKVKYNDYKNSKSDSSKIINVDTERNSNLVHHNDISTNNKLILSKKSAISNKSIVNKVDTDNNNLKSISTLLGTVNNSKITKLHLSEIHKLPNTGLNDTKNSNKEMGILASILGAFTVLGVMLKRRK